HQGRSPNGPGGRAQGLPKPGPHPATRDLPKGGSRGGPWPWAAASFRRTLRPRGGGDHASNMGSDGNPAGGPQEARNPPPDRPIPRAGRAGGGGGRVARAPGAQSVQLGTQPATQAII